MLGTKPPTKGREPRLRKAAETRPPDDSIGIIVALAWYISVMRRLTMAAVTTEVRKITAIIFHRFLITRQ
jgi:hypothetical protein